MLLFVIVTCVGATTPDWLTLTVAVAVPAVRRRVHDREEDSELGLALRESELVPTLDAVSQLGALLTIQSRLLVTDTTCEPPLELKLTEVGFAIKESGSSLSVLHATNATLIMPTIIIVSRFQKILFFFIIVLSLIWLLIC